MLKFGGKAANINNALASFAPLGGAAARQGRSRSTLVAIAQASCGKTKHASAFLFSLGWIGLSEDDVKVWRQSRKY
jgi:hypothetical protein